MDQGRRVVLRVVEKKKGGYKRRCLSNRVIEDRLKQVGGLRFKFNVEVGKGINVRFDKADKI